MLAKSTREKIRLIAEQANSDRVRIILEAVAEAGYRRAGDVGVIDNKLYRMFMEYDPNDEEKRNVHPYVAAALVNQLGVNALRPVSIFGVPLIAMLMDGIEPPLGGPELDEVAGKWLAAKIVASGKDGDELAKYVAELLVREPGFGDMLARKLKEKQNDKRYSAEEAVRADNEVSEMPAEPEGEPSKAVDGKKKKRKKSES